MGKFVQSQNYYEILEVPKTAPQDEIHRAYQRSKETYSNDNPALYTVFSKDEAIELLKLIEEAYQVLSNQESRQRYDQVIKRQATDVRTGDPMAAPQVKKDELPQGHAKSKFSVYKIDNNVEDEIQSCKEYSGEMLKRIREYKNIELLALSEHTRISRTYLTALEQENFAALPAAVFSRGFIIQYTKLLGLNEKDITKSFMEKLNSTAES